MTRPQALSALYLPLTATNKEIRTQYLRLAKTYHPDTGDNPNEDAFIWITKAYRELTSRGELKTCEECSGKGRISKLTGMVSHEVQCTKCNGAGTYK